MTLCVCVWQGFVTYSTWLHTPPGAFLWLPAWFDLLFVAWHRFRQKVDYYSRILRAAEWRRFWNMLRRTSECPRSSPAAAVQQKCGTDVLGRIWGSNIRDARDCEKPNWILHELKDHNTLPPGQKLPSDTTWFKLWKINYHIWKPSNN